MVNLGFSNSTNNRNKTIMYVWITYYVMHVDYLVYSVSVLKIFLIAADDGITDNELK